MQNTKIIVLLAAHQGANFIEEQLNSIIYQSHKPYKILINYDLSSDNTLDIIKSYKKKYLNIDIIETNQKFGSAASSFFYMLKTFNFTKFDFISLADQDDIWHKNKLKNAVSKLNKGFDGYSSNVEAFWKNGKKKIIYKNQAQNKFDFFFESAGPGCTFVMKKSFILEFQKFLCKNKFNRIHQYHDWLIYAYARSFGYRWVIDDYIGMQYRQHSKNVFGANVGLKAFMSRVNRVLSGEGFDFSFKLMNELKVQDQFIQSLIPITRINFFRLAFSAKKCRRRVRDQIYFFFACILLFFIYPKRLRIT
jgi:rhamnosyltransferase